MSDRDLEARLRADLRRAADTAPPLRWTPPQAGPATGGSDDAVPEIGTPPGRRRGARAAGAVLAAAAVLAVGAVVIDGPGGSPEPPPAAVPGPTDPAAGEAPAAPPPGGGVVAGACALGVDFEGRGYVDAGPAGPEQRGRVLGEGVVTPCDDAPGQTATPSPVPVVVHELVGMPPAEGVWVDGSRLSVTPPD